MEMSLPTFKMKRDIPILIGVLVIFGLIYFYSDFFHTLASFQQVNDSSIYVMTHHGDYQMPEEYTELLAAYPQQMTDFPTFAENTTIVTHNFLAKNPEGHPLVGFNLYDYHTGPTLFLLNKPDTGYQSVSLVNLAYIGVDNPADLNFFQRKQLLLAPSVPLAGMNEHGLIITCSGVNSSEVPYQPEQKTITGFAAIRLILDQTQTTAEALQLLEKYNLRFTPWPHLHYLIADATGQSVIVEFKDGEMVTNSRDEFAVMTNLYADEKADSHWQHDFLTQELTNKEGLITEAEMIQLLDVASEAEGLRWTAIFDGLTREVKLALKGNFASFHQFVLHTQ